MQSLLRNLFILVSAITFTACGGGGGDDGPSYSLSTESVSFEAAQGGSTPAAKTVTVNVSGGTVYVDVQASSPYFSVNFSITGSTTGEIRITPASPNIAAGDYAGTITVFGCTDALCNEQLSGSPKTINVSYRITSLDIVQQGLNFNLLEGSATDVKPVDFNYTGSTTTWTAGVTPGSGTSGWWSLSASSGSGFPAQIMVTADASGIPLGVHTATLNISVGGSTKTVPMTLVVGTPVVNFVSPYVAVTNSSDEVVIRGYGFSTLSGASVSFGATPASTFTIVSDTEIRATHPTLVAGNYPVTVGDSSTTLTSNASLLVKDAPAFSYSALARTSGVSRIIFDAEREALYMFNPTTDLVERYSHNGTNWVLAGTWSIGPTGTFGRGLTLSRDGKTLYVTYNNLIYPVDLTTNNVGSAVDVFPFANSIRFISAANDGQLIVNATFGNYLFSYDTLNDILIPLSNSFRYANSYIEGSMDGRRILLPFFALGLTAEPVTYYDASTAGIVTSGLLTNSLGYVVSLDRSGKRSILWHDGAIDEHRVYDQDFNLLGSLPALDGLSTFDNISSAISPDGTRAYTYNDTTGRLRVYDLDAPDGSGGFTEIGSGLTLADSTGSGPRMIVTPDGGTIILLGSSNLITTPVP